ncbi:MAG: hypothetical protein Q7R82_00405 [Candidatus Daviesbacteria bacterium]|nr:hypothetical protein [Candidatus Daviesbacteria bacterium]
MATEHMPVPHPKRGSNYGIHGPSSKDIKAVEAGEYKDGSVMRFIKRHPLATGGTTAIVAAIAADRAIPAFHQTVDNTYHNFLQKIGIEVVASTTFDNKKDQQVIGDSNTVRITPEEANAQGLLTPKINLENKTVTAPFPFILPPGTTTIIDKTPYSVRGIEHTNPRFILPAGTKIIFPEQTGIIFIRGGAEGGADPNAIYTIIATYADPESNIFQQWQINVTDAAASNIHTDNTALTPTEFVALLKKYGWDYSRMESDKAVTRSDGEKPVAFIGGGTQLVSFTSSTSRGPKTDFTAEIIPGMKEEFPVVNDKLMILVPST